MRRRLIIIGTGGLAREMAMIVEHVNARDHRWDLMGFIGNSTALVGKDLGLGAIIGDDDWLLSQSFEADLVIAIGRPQVRAGVLARYLEQGDRFEYPNLIHPSATLDFRRVEFGRGNVITAGCRFTCDIEVQDFNLFNSNVTVGYDAHIGSCNVIHAGVNIASGVQIGDRNLLGSGCQILEYISIGDGLSLEPGAVVRHDVLEEW
ncbi:MAG TPA: acetyltransferase [Stenomitos sp.]